MVLQVTLFHRHVPTCHEYPAWRRTHEDAQFHTIHQKTAEDKSDNLVCPIQPNRTHTILASRTSTHVPSRLSCSLFCRFLVQ